MLNSLPVSVHREVFMLIAQITDIHAAPDNDHLERLEQVLSWLEQVGPDIMVLSGDLTDGGWDEGYVRIAAQLEEQAYPTLILPGNSDDRGCMRKTWGNERWLPDSQGEFLHFSHNAGGICLAGVDSSVSEQNYGSLSGRMGWLENQLGETDDAPVLLFLHHHIFPCGIPTLDETICRGLSEFEELIRRYPDRLLAVSSGHVHRPVGGTFAGIPANICGSVCPTNPLWFGSVSVPPVRESPMLMIHRYERGKLSSHHVCV